METRCREAASPRLEPVSDWFSQTIIDLPLKGANYSDLAKEDQCPNNDRCIHHTTKDLIFTHEAGKVTAYIVLENSQHVVKSSKYDIEVITSLANSMYYPDCFLF